MKRFLSLLLCCCALCSCARQQKDPNTVTMWHWMTDRHEVLQQLANQYEEQTGVKVSVELYAPPDAYSKKIIVAAQAKVLPDIFGVLDKKEIFAAFVKNGYVTDLTDAFARDDGIWEKMLFPKLLDVNRFESSNTYGVQPGIYGVPLDGMNIQMVYNKALLKKAGYDAPPQTFDEFLEIAAALKRIGISGFVSGWGELWMLGCFASNYAFNIMGEEKIMATYRGDVPYTDPDWIQVLSVFKRLKDNGVLIEDVATKLNKAAEQDFALERAAFAFNGSWSVNVYHKMNPDLEYAAMLPPAISSKFPMRIWGLAGSSFMVNNQTARKGGAIAFLKWLTEKEQQEILVKKTKNLPANKDAAAVIPPELLSFARASEQTTHPTVWKYNEAAQVQDAFEEGIQSILIGDKTPEQVAGELQELKQKVLAKEQKRKQEK